MILPLLIVLLIYTAITGYHFYFEKIIKPKNILEEKKDNEEYFKISTLIDKHNIMRHKFLEFNKEQKKMIETDEYLFRDKSKSFKNVTVFGHEVRIYNEFAVGSLKNMLKSTLSELESDKHQRALINSIVEDRKDLYKKNDLENNIRKDNFHLYYLKHKPLLKRIFPVRRIGMNNLESFTIKTREEVIEDIGDFKSVPKELAIDIFNELTANIYWNSILREKEGKYFFCDEKTILNY